MMIYFSISLILVVLTPAHSAGDRPVYPSSTHILSDSTEVTVRRPPAGVLDVYLDDPDYTYARLQTEVPTWWGQFKRWFYDWFLKRFEENQQGKVWEYIFYATAVALLAFAIIRFLKMEVRSLFSVKKRSKQRMFEVVDEDLYNKDFLWLAEEALQQNNFRLAARMYYMHVLKVLDEKEAITWRPRKTNQDYLNECRLPEFKPAFARLTYLFDYLWYGDFPVDHLLIEEMKTLAKGVGNKQGGM